MWLEGMFGIEDWWYLGESDSVLVCWLALKENIVILGEHKYSELPTIMRL
jgi:hypothetical protein